MTAGRGVTPTALEACWQNGGGVLIPGKSAPFNKPNSHGQTNEVANSTWESVTHASAFIGTDRGVIMLLQSPGTAQEMRRKMWSCGCRRSVFRPCFALEAQ